MSECLALIFDKNQLKALKIAIACTNNTDLLTDHYVKIYL